MALSLDNSTGWSNGYYIRHLATATQDLVNNQSTVRVRAWIYSSAYNSFWGISSYHYQSIDGVVKVDGNYVRDVATGSSAIILDNTQVVTHNADGTRSVSFYSEFSNAYTGTQAISGTLVLDTIPRATTPNISGNFVTGTSKTINLPRASSSFTHDVSYKFGTKTGTIATGAGVTTTWTPDKSLFTEVTNGTNGSVEITVVTKSGTTTIGTKKVNFTLEASSDIKPTVSNVTWTENNPTIKSNIGAFVEGQSIVSGLVTSTGIYGSTIVSEQLTINGISIPEGALLQINGNGVISGVGSATDSRGRVGTKTQNLTVLPYTPPYLGSNGWQIRRAESSGTPSDTGQYLRLDLHAIVKSLVVSSTEKNSMVISVKTRPSGGAWTQRNSINAGLTYNTNVLISGGGIFLVSSSYEVEVLISDKTGSPAMVLRTTVPTAIVTLDLNGANVGIGKYHEFGTLDVAGDIYTNGSKVSIEGHTHSTADITSGTLASARLPNASETAKGAVERATQAEVDSGTDTTRYISPSSARNASYTPFSFAAGNITTAASGSTTVTFPVGRFTSVPIVNNQVVGHPNVSVVYVYGWPSTTSFNIGVFTISGGNIAAQVQWIAVQMTSGNANG